MEKAKCNIVFFPKVKDYRSVKPEDILTEGKIVWNGIIEETDYDKRECRVNFIGELAESKKPMPIGIVSERHDLMVLMPKAEVSISGGKAVIKWHEIKRRKGLASLMLIQLTYL